MYAIFENRRSGRDRRQRERRQPPVAVGQLPRGQERRGGTDRRSVLRRASDRPDAIPECYDYLWRNRWP